MRMITRMLLCGALLLCLLTVPVASAGRKQPQGAKSSSFHTEGTFSNIKAGPEGDYGGMQIYLTDSDGQFYAAVTIAEGVLLAPVLVKVDVQIESRKISFALPGEDGSRKFTGTVSADGLTLLEGGSKSFLKRKC